MPMRQTKSGDKDLQSVLPYDFNMNEAEMGKYFAMSEAFHFGEVIFNQFLLELLEFTTM